ncbi:hypothetical protein Tco_1124552 [Tanacetum coccineum]|uniref:Uncharacterized protein n=1 Tax=Tanacetum coccineum TaxID=301880 RepID=A0ABQ5J6G6_9ASTR
MGLLMNIKQNHPNSFKNTSNFDSNGGDDGVINGGLDQRFFKPLSPKTPILRSATTATPQSTKKIDFYKQEPEIRRTKMATAPGSTDTLDFGNEGGANETTNKAVKRSLFPKDTPEHSKTKKD